MRPKDVRRGRCGGRRRLGSHSEDPKVGHHNGRRALPRRRDQTIAHPHQVRPPRRYGHLIRLFPLACGDGHNNGSRRRPRSRWWQRLLLLLLLYFQSCWRENVPFGYFNFWTEIFHNDLDSRVGCLRIRFLILDSLLHPDTFDLLRMTAIQVQHFIHNSWHSLTIAEDINHINTCLGAARGGTVIGGGIILG